MEEPFRVNPNRAEGLTSDRRIGFEVDLSVWVEALYRADFEGDVPPSVRQKADGDGGDQEKNPS